jgi:3-hydroxybutyryl-CoA dehydratase
MTYYLDELVPGMSESIVRTVTEHDIELFGEATGDRNPVHFDETFAGQTIFKGRVAHGALSAGFISAVLGMKIPGPGAIFVSLTVRFKAAVRIGDAVETVCTVREIAGKRRVTFDCVCKVGDLVVTEGEAVVVPPGRPKG